MQSYFETSRVLLDHSVKEFRSLLPTHTNESIKPVSFDLRRLKISVSE